MSVCQSAPGKTPSRVRIVLGIITKPGVNTGETNTKVLNTINPMKINEIEKAFVETQYVIQLQSDIVLKIGEIPAELLEKLALLETWAFITAWNPLPDILSIVENERRNEDLQQYLLDRGYTIHKGIGTSKDQSWSEESFFIENIELEDARTASAKFGQLAFVYGDRHQGNKLVFI
jgi:hypothetical protein